MNQRWKRVRALAKKNTKPSLKKNEKNHSSIKMQRRRREYTVKEADGIVGFSK